MADIQFGYKKLIAWEVANELARSVYKLSLSFPKDEAYGLTSQLRRAALSIPTNIVEGHARQGQNEFRHFLSISLGSLAETEYLLKFAFELGHISKADYESIENIRSRCGQLVWTLHKSQK